MQSSSISDVLASRHVELLAEISRLREENARLHESLADSREVGNRGEAPIAIEEHRDMLEALRAAKRQASSQLCRLHRMGHESVDRFVELSRRLEMMWVANTYDNTIWAKTGPATVDSMASVLLLSMDPSGWNWWNDRVLKGYVHGASNKASRAAGGGGGAGGGAGKRVEVCICDAECLTKVWRDRMDACLEVSYLLGKSDRSASPPSAGAAGAAGEGWSSEMHQKQLLSRRSTCLPMPMPTRVRQQLLSFGIGELDIAEMRGCEVILFVTILCGNDPEKALAFSRSAARFGAETAGRLNEAFLKEIGEEEGAGGWKPLLAGDDGGRSAAVDRVVGEILAQSRAGRCVWQIRVPFRGDEELRDIEELERRGVMVRNFAGGRREFAIFKLCSASAPLPVACVFVEEAEAKEAGKKRSCRLSGFADHRLRSAVSEEDDGSDLPGKDEAYPCSLVWANMLDAMMITTSQQSRADAYVMHQILRERDRRTIEKCVLKSLDGFYPPPSPTTAAVVAEREAPETSDAHVPVIADYVREKRTTKLAHDVSQVKMDCLRRAESSKEPWEEREDGEICMAPDFLGYISAQANIGLGVAGERIRVAYSEERGGDRSKWCAGAATLSIDSDPRDLELVGGRQGWPRKLLMAAYARAKPGRTETDADSVLGSVTARLRFFKPHLYNRRRSSRMMRECMSEKERASQRWIYESADIVCGKMMVITIDGLIPKEGGGGDAHLAHPSEVLRFGQVVRRYVARVLSVMAGFSDVYASSGTFGDMDSEEFRSMWIQTHPLFHATVMSIVVTAMVDQVLEEKYSV